MRLATALLAASAVSFGALAISAPARATAFITTICTETASGGCVQELPVGGTTVTVASDGEAPFDPFGAGYDTSDGIQLDAQWVPKKTIGWNQLPNSNTWVLPACDGSGSCENGKVDEPIGEWRVPDQALSVNLAIFKIREADGSLSDVIKMFNSNGGVDVTFDSSPGGAVPEVSTWALMLLGVGVTGAMLRRRTALAVA